MLTKYFCSEYAASEKPLEGISSAKLAAAMRARGIDVTQLDRGEDIIKQVLGMAEPGDLIITMGAGDVTELGHKIADCLCKWKNE